METSVVRNKVATWLELAVAPDWRRNDCRVRIHAVAGRDDNCYTISIDDRWLCVGSGELTVFHGLSAALHFLKLLRVEDFEPGETTPLPSVNSGNYYCLCNDRGKGLLPCKCLQSRAAATH